MSFVFPRFQRGDFHESDSYVKGLFLFRWGANVTSQRRSIICVQVGYTNYRLIRVQISYQFCYVCLYTRNVWFAFGTRVRINSFFGLLNVAFQCKRLCFRQNSFDRLHGSDNQENMHTSASLSRSSGPIGQNARLNRFSVHFRCFGVNVRHYWVYLGLFMNFLTSYVPFRRNILARGAIFYRFRL